MALNSEFHFREHGIQKIAAVLQPEEIARLRKIFPEDVSGIRRITEKFPSLLDLARSDVFKSLFQKLNLGRPDLVRSLYFDKNEKRNWNVAWHQDLTVSVDQKIETPGFGPWSEKDGVTHVQPPVEILERMFTLRIHLDDCDASNGALRVVPNSHLSGKLSPVRIRELTRDGEHICVARAGDAILMRPLLLHASSKARRPGHRRVLHFEFSPDELPKGLDWAERV